MYSADWSDADNVRNQAIAQLAEICAAMGLSWSAGEKKFVIDLPDVIVRKRGVEISMDGYVGPRPPLMPTERKTFDISTWGPNSGIYEDKPNLLDTVDGPPFAPGEAMPDDFQMPENGEILEEGEPPANKDEK